jgi:hypothetical protein
MGAVRAFMREAQFNPSESDKVSLRAVIADIELDLSCLAREAPADEHRFAIDALIASWARLVELLALGAAPLLRQCPRCGNSVRRAATRCGHCWSSLAPLAEDVPQ